MNSKSKQSTVSHAESSSTSVGHNPILIQRALEEIFLSTPFRTTRQCQDLLRYVVDNTLAGLDQLLRERVIGSEVFGRKPDYDTSEDPVVRLRAAEVRKRLAQYYQSVNGGTPVRIDIPSGSYRATFEWLTPVEPQLLVASVVEEPKPTSLVSLEPVHEPSMSGMDRLRHKTPSGNRIWIASSILILAILAGALLRATRSTPESEFSRFWSPMLGGAKPVLICMGSNAVYRLSSDFSIQYLKDHRLENHGMEFFIELPPDTPIQARYIQKAYNSFVALGDVAAASDIVATLTRQSASFQQRFPPDISFAELQNSPTITIGGFNNPLTMTLTKDLRFALAQGSRVEDHQSSRVWAVKFNGDSHDAEDYAVVSRLLDSKSGGPVISVAGIGQYGTRAAAEFVSSPQRIADLMKAAPKGWNRRNLQVVLHIKVVNFRPVSTDVVAADYW